MSGSRSKPAVLRGAALVISFGTAIALLSACSSTDSSPVSVAESVEDVDSMSTQVASDPAWGHVHNLALIGDVLFIGSHEGFWRHTLQQEPVLVSDPAFGVMGLFRSGNRWLASGHPGPNMDAPSVLGLLESQDSGVTWQSVSLLGEVDFHRLVSTGDVVLGVNAHSNSLLRSTDGGHTWRDLGTPPLFDLAIDPADPNSVFATTEAGPVRSTDGGITFTPGTSPVLLALLAWTEQGLYASAVDGQIFHSTDSGTTWDTRGTLGGQPAALAADSSNVVGVVGDSIFGSSDGGVTFNKRVAGSGGH